jgi:hypothetical protein
MVSTVADQAWKTWEREVANSLGGTRTGPMGRDLPDSIDCPLVAPEAKLYKKFVFLEKDMEQAVENAAIIGKLPVLAVKERMRGGRKRVQMNWEDFLVLFEKARGYDELMRPNGMHDILAAS